MNKLGDIRPSPIAGSWYPADPEELSRSLDKQLSLVSPAVINGDIIGVIAPHAGYIYSGETAALAFSALKGLEPAIVAVISPLHRSYPGQILTSAHQAYATPLGPIPIAHDVLERLDEALSSQAGIQLSRIRNDTEHSLEIELPFLQRVLGQPFQLLPLMLLDQSQMIVESLAHALAATLDGMSAILVGSTDLSHFYPGPVAEQLDAEMLSRIKAFNPAGVISADDEGVGFACGRGAAACVLWAGKDLGADSVEILGYANSGDVTGDYASVVGYGAAAIYRAAYENA